MNAALSNYVDGATSRTGLHKDQKLCTQVLETVTAAVPLRILPSNIPGAGTGLFVTKDVGYGEEIFRSDPLVNCVNNEMQSLVCDYCYAYQESKVLSSGRFRTTNDSKLEIMACNGCRVCYYCSKACQKKAWKHYHKVECVMLFENPDLYPRTRALYRLLNINKHRHLSREQWLAVQELQSNVIEHLGSANSESVIASSDLARSCTGTDLRSSEVLILHCTLLTNCLTIYQAEGKMLGTSLDIAASLTNHSCDPNAFVVFEGNSLRVRSIRKLQAGEEITQCYTHVDMDVLFRRQMLKSEYFFDCRCKRCEKQMQMYEERFSGKIELIEQSQEQLVKHIQAVTPDNIDSFETEAENIAKKAFPSGDWPHDLGPWPSLRIQLARMLKVRGRFVEALMQGVRGVLSLEQRTGDVWTRHLFDLLQIISKVLTLPKQDTSYGEAGFPAESQLWDILYGYLQEVARSANKMFGADARYTKAIQDWYSHWVRFDNTRKPGTRAFAQRFKRAQSRLLLWAGIDENRGVVLT